MNDRSGFGGLDDRQYVGIGEASSLLGLSRTSVQKLVDAGRLLAVKTEGGHRRILRDSLRDQLDQMARRIGPDGGTLSGPLPTGAPATRRAGPLQIQIVDDDAVALTLLRSTVQRALPQAQVTLARDGVEAVLMLERLRPDLLITDLHMQPFDGWQLSWLVHERPEFAGVQILALTVATDAEIAERGGLPPGALVRHKPVPHDWLTGWLQAHAQVHERAGR